MEKNVFITVALLLFFGVYITVQGQQTKVVEIQTSAQCEMYKERLESNLTVCCKKPKDRGNASYH